ncbi:MAG: hypothetical protein GX091_00185 [Peptococcaceae bacterium]|nr:hypothetical protein [Peptococcaceae bacterium]
MYWEKNFSDNQATAIGLNNTAADNSFPPYSVPFTVSLLISGSLFNDNNSPASSLIIPLLRREIPFGYFIIILLDFITALVVKWSYLPYSYSILPGSWNTALPSLQEIRGIYRAPNESTPFLPTKGINFNISFSSTFLPSGRTGTLYIIELTEIKKIPGFVVPIAALVLYLILRAKK